MKRLIAVLLALLLPLQLSWAAVGEYCQHESSPQAAQHFGHHAHVHTDEGTKDGGKTAIDSDCSFCHTGAAATMAAQAPHVPEIATGSSLVTLVQPAHASALARPPDRPQWVRLA